MADGDRSARNVLPKSICRKCKTNEGTIRVRTDNFCTECFINYVHTKITKRLDSFRVRFASNENTRKFCLPISMGISSVTLLYVLDRHLQHQKSKTGRTGFDLQILYIDSSSVDRNTPNSQLIQKLKAEFPAYAFTIESLSTVLDSGESITSLLSEAGAPLNGAPDDATTETSDTRFQKLLAGLPSATARSDVVSLLRTQLIVQSAKDFGCEGIFWGDTTTRLAEKTLSETAKGRGFSLPWQLADGETPHGIDFHYPMRDLLKKELLIHADLASPPLSLFIQPEVISSQVAVSAKNTTIDDLMRQYFQSVEENFPSIVANVVRTTSKLEAPSISTTGQHCSLCHMIVPDGKFGIHGWGGDQGDAGTGSSNTDDNQKQLCYGCTRSV